MAWVRTATSLISFGFTIYKFFEYWRENSERASPSGSVGPRELAVIMIGIGLGSLVIATIQHRRELVILRTQYGAVVPLSLATVTATLIGLLGVVLLLAVIFRM